MIARYSDAHIAAAGPHQIDIQIRLTNADGEVWSSNQQYFLSYQVFDAATENLIVDGPRIALGMDVAPGSTTPQKVSVSLPSEPGRYRVFLSPLREHVAWFFERGSPFLLIDAEVGAGAVKIRRWAVTTARRLGWQRLFRAMGRAFIYPLRAMMENWSLIRSMVRRDIVGRYRGSYGGLFWTVIHPLMMMLTYWFVFGLVLQTRFGEDGRSSNFVLYFLAGMLPWLAFSEAVGRAPMVIVEHAGFVKKLRFPVEILPVNLVLAGLISETFGVAIFLGALAFFGHPIPTTAVYLPLLLIPQFFLTLGLSWFLAGLGVFFRDLGQFMGFLLTVWFFTTPICYPESALPQGYLWLFEKNPMYVLVKAYRSIFLEPSAPAWGPLLGLTAATLAIFIAGHGWFYKLKKSFADMV